MSDLASSARRGFPWLVLAGVLVAALSLRSPIVSPTPVMRDIEQDLGIGSATAGLLTTAPVLMFAVLTPVAALVIRRAGAELALMLTLSGVLIGTFVRALPGFGAMLTGMLIIGASITIGNIVIPVIIRRDVPGDRVALVLAAYVATMNAGSLLTTLLTAPLASVVGWSAALLTWGAITVAGVVLWGLHLDRERRAGRLSGSRDSGAVAGPRASRASGATASATSTGTLEATITGPMPATGQERSALRHPVVWLLMAAFASQSAIYYGLSTWLPAIAHDTIGLDQTAAGALASVFQGVAVVGAFIVPLLARFTPSIVPTLTICASFLVLTAGMLLAPAQILVWLIFGAIAHSGGFVVIFAVLVGVARSDAQAASMSAVVQGGGYAIAAFGAPVMGALLEITGGWDAALVLMAALAVAYSAALLTATRVAQSSTR